VTKDLKRFAEAIATIAEKIGAELGWWWLMVVAAADSEVGGKKDGGSGKATYAGAKVRAITQRALTTLDIMKS
jgi:hypothetical protein